MPDTNRSTDRRTPNPPYLQRIYPIGCSLEGLLRQLLEVIPGGAAVAAALNRDVDPLQYKRDLLNDTFACLASDAPSLRTVLSFTQQSAQVEVRYVKSVLLGQVWYNHTPGKRLKRLHQVQLVHRATEMLIYTQPGTNVMCFGFRKVRPSAHINYVQPFLTHIYAMQRRPSTRAQYVQGLHRTEAYSPNTTIKLLTGPAWQLLLSRIGDTLMLHLLMHTTLFTPVFNGSLLQLSGMPVSQVCPSLQHLQI